MNHFAESPTYHLSRLFWIAISFYRSLSLFPVVCASQCLSCFVSVRRVNIAFSRIVWRRTDQRVQQCCIWSDYWYFSCRDGSFRKFRFVKFSCFALDNFTLTFPHCCLGNCALFKPFSAVAFFFCLTICQILPCQLETSLRESRLERHRFRMRRVASVLLQYRPSILRFEQITS